MAHTDGAASAGRSARPRFAIEYAPSLRKAHGRSCRPRTLESEVGPDLQTRTDGNDASEGGKRDSEARPMSELGWAFGGIHHLKVLLSVGKSNAQTPAPDSGVLRCTGQ